MFSEYFVSANQIYCSTRKLDKIGLKEKIRKKESWKFFSNAFCSQTKMHMQNLNRPKCAPFQGLQQLLYNPWAKMKSWAKNQKKPFFMIFALYKKSLKIFFRYSEIISTRWYTGFGHMTTGTYPMGMETIKTRPFGPESTFYYLYIIITGCYMCPEASIVNQTPWGAKWWKIGNF